MYILEFGCKYMVPVFRGGGKNFSGIFFSRSHRKYVRPKTITGTRSFVTAHEYWAGFVCVFSAHYMADTTTGIYSAASSVVWTMGVNAIISAGEGTLLPRPKPHVRLRRLHHAATAGRTIVVVVVVATIWPVDVRLRRSRECARARATLADDSYNIHNNIMGLRRGIRVYIGLGR